MISIVMPTFNRAHLLNKRIDEFKNQTFKDWELIIVDDGSTDDTKDICLEYTVKSNDNRIKYIRLDTNSHCVSIPRNIGITRSRGEYIFHADDDDIHHKDALETLYNLLESNKDAILAYGDRFVIQNGTRSLVRKPDWNPTLPEGWGVCNGQFMYRRTAFDTIPLIFCKRACDWRLCSELFKIGRFIYTPKVILTVVWHGGNRSLDPTTKIRPLDIEFYKDYFKGYKILEILQA